MLHVRLQRMRRRWSVQHGMDALTEEPPAPAPAPADPARRWSLSAPADAAPADRPRRRRRPRALRTPRLSHASAIVAGGDAVVPLHAHLPARHHACDWQCVYSTMRHGVSLKTFYANCSGPDPVVLLIRDSAGAVFGCYTSVAWRASKQYYGTGEGFVFTLTPDVAVYKWSRANSYFQLGSADSIAMGGGGKFALFLDSMFERGSSGPCATFNSPCLASSSEFDVVVLEAYKLVSPYKFRMGPEES